jgi:16S rRNA G966 N2-methylase RsmD
MDTWKYLSAVKMQFDLIFADPPYDLVTAQYHNIIEKVFTNQLLDKQGLLIIEHSEQEGFEEHPRFSQSRKYGSNVFSFFEQ